MYGVIVGSRPSLLQCKYEHVLPYFSVKLQYLSRSLDKYSMELFD